MKKLLVAVIAGVLMAACSEAPTAPSAPKAAASNRPNADDVVCSSGYVIAYDENGNPYCAPVDGGSTTMAGPAVAVPMGLPQP